MIYRDVHGYRKFYNSVPCTTYLAKEKFDKNCVPCRLLNIKKFDYFIFAGSDQRH
jgi:hypothetical protein